MVGSGLYLAAIGLLGLGLGALVRNSAGAVAALFGTLFALQIVVGLLPEDTADSVNRYLPVPAGSALTLARPDTLSLAPWAGFGLLCGYVAVLLALAARRLRRRDT
ncbi:ABC transporter permease subunit [Parafrankia sp. BMG5.11]|nr:ABC transporter permease subunit [Parafrankia sp. BMG5.11]TCJ31351.1 hypothetical protein E0504_49175 [Parafrankia sp. BMG5.11]